MSTLSFYNTNKDFKRYVDRFKNLYKYDLGYALECSVVKNAELYYRELELEESMKRPFSEVSCSSKVFKVATFSGLYNYLVISKEIISSEEALIDYLKNRFSEDEIKIYNFYIGDCFVRESHKNENTDRSICFLPSMDAAPCFVRESKKGENDGWSICFQPSENTTPCWVVAPTREEVDYLNNKYKKVNIGG